MKIDESIQNGRNCFAAILAYAQQAETVGWDAQELSRVIKAHYHYPMDAQLGALIEQLRVNEGIPWDANGGFHDLRPDLSVEERRKRILQAMAEDHPPEIVFFEWFLKHLQIGDERLAVEKVCERDYDFIIYRLVDGEGFVLSEVCNHSSVMWTVEKKITHAQVIDTIRNPRWGGELKWDKHSSLGPADFGLESFA